VEVSGNNVIRKFEPLKRRVCNARPWPSHLSLNHIGAPQYFSGDNEMSGVRAVSTGLEILVERLRPPGLPNGVSGS
jgi:hypothetical protein